MYTRIQEQSFRYMRGIFPNVFGGMYMLFKLLILIYTLWFETGKEDKELIDNEEFFKNKNEAFIRTQVIANVTGKVVLVRRIRLCSTRCIEYTFLSDEE